MAVWDRTADAVFGVAAAVLLGGTVVALVVSWGGGYWLPGLVAGAAVCVIALLRRRDRTRAAVAGLAVAVAAIAASRLAGLPAEPGPGVALGLSVLVGAAVRALAVRTAGAVAAGGLVVAVGGPLLAAHPAAGGSVALAGANGAAWLAGVATGLWLRLSDERRLAMAETVRRDERLALARELHDVVAHHVTGIVVQAQAARVVARRRPERLEDSLAGIEAAGSDALTAMRRVVRLLRDTQDGAPAKPGPERLETLVARFNGAARLTMPDGAEGWRPEVTSTVYRIVQESLTNVSRHAPSAELITVTVTDDAGTVTVEVADAAPLRDGFGLVGMRERVEALGGTFTAGWSIRAVLPK